MCKIHFIYDINETIGSLHHLIKYLMKGTYYELNFITKIKEKADSLSRAERQVAKYILDHADLVQTYTISEISINANVSQASVVRFCKRMGIDSFKTFQHTLVKEMSSNNANINDFSLLRENDTPYQLFQKVTMSNKFALESLGQTLNKKSLKKQ